MRENDEVAADQAVAEQPTIESDVAVDPEQDGGPEVVPSLQDERAVESLRELVVFLVENLTDASEQAEVVADQRGSLVQIQVRVPESELGKVIGRGGRIAKAIRTALMIAGSRHHLRVSLDIES